MRFHIGLIASLLLVVVHLTMTQPQISADLVLLQGKIWTVNERQPEAEAVACRAGRILAVGTNDQVSRLIGPETRVIRLDGKRVVPGFNDAHVHFFDGGRGLSSVQLRDARTPLEFRERIQTFARSLAKAAGLQKGTGITRTGRLLTCRSESWLMQSRPAIPSSSTGLMVTWHLRIRSRSD